MNLYKQLPVLVAMVAAPASAQIVERKLTPSEIAQEAAKQCRVQPTFISVRKLVDGRSAYQISPTLSAAQENCVRGVVGRYGVYVRR